MNSTTSEAPSEMNQTLASDFPSQSPVAIPIPTPNQNETILSPMMSVGNETAPSLSPNANDTISLVPTPVESTQQFLERSLRLEMNTLTQSGTYQNMAYTSLIESFPDLTTMAGDQVELLQIFALNAIYYSLNGTEWKTRTSWATGPNKPCIDPTWYGITCNADDLIVKLDLSDNDLLGSLPSEMSGLTNLGTRQQILMQRHSLLDDYLSYH
jgi:hypothetical protein